MAVGTIGGKEDMEKRRGFPFLQPGTKDGTENELGMGWKGWGGLGGLEALEGIGGRGNLGGGGEG